jgi:hypothetical protein
MQGPLRTRRKGKVLVLVPVGVDKIWGYRHLVPKSWTTYFPYPVPKGTNKENTGRRDQLGIELVLTLRFPSCSSFVLVPYRSHRDPKEKK